MKVELPIDGVQNSVNKITLQANTNLAIPFPDWANAFLLNHSAVTYWRIDAAAVAPDGVTWQAQEGMVTASMNAVRMIKNGPMGKKADGNLHSLNLITETGGTALLEFLKLE